MIIAAITDLHSDAGRLPGLACELAAADVVLLTGDITQFGKAAEARAMLDAVRREAKRGAVMLSSSRGEGAAAAGPRIFAVAGNCDHAEVEEFLAREGLSLHGRHEAVGGVEFAGAGRSLPCPGGGTPNEAREEDFTATLKEAAAGVPEGAPLALALHQPPRDTACDRSWEGRHAGSSAVRAFIERAQPILVFCGHLHESRGTDQVGRTRIINPGPLREGGYAWAEVTDGQVTRLEVRGIPQ